MFGVARVFGDLGCLGAWGFGMFGGVQCDVWGVGGSVPSKVR